MRKCGKGTLLLMSAVMAASLQGVGRVRVVRHRKMKSMQRSKKAISQHLQHRSVPGFLTGQKIIGCFRMKE